MASIVNLFVDAANKIKGILTTQEFGAEYEIVCTELRLEWLRIRLWGESVGINIDEPDLTRTNVFTRPEIQLTVTQAVGSITHLLSEVESLRHKYDLRLDWQALPAGMNVDNKSDEFDARRLTSPPTSINPSPWAMVRQRMNDNQKQKSFLKLAKWAMSDAKKFEEKVAQLKRLIDSLESVSRSAEIAPLQPPGYSQAIRERPPPYTDDSDQTLSAHTLPSTTLQDAFSFPFQPAQSTLSQPLWFPSRPPVARLTSAFSPHMLGQFSEHYSTFTTYMTGMAHPTRSNTQAKDKLASLSSVQFSELRTDVYDDLLRRQEYEGANGHVFNDLLDRGQEQSHSDVFIACLPDRDAYHPKRNLARRRLSSLPPARFKDLVSDVLAEMDHRVSLPISPSFSAPSPSSTAIALPVALNVPCARTPSSPPMTSFRVSPRSTTQDILPIAMEKYNITGPPSQYCLTINCGHVERFLHDEEKPLAIFQSFENGSPPYPKVVVRRKIYSDPSHWTVIPDEPVKFLPIKDMLSPLPSTATTPSKSTTTTKPPSWPLPQVLTFLTTHSFSPEWHATFTYLNINGDLFLELGCYSGGKGNLAFMHLQIFPQLYKEYVKSGRGWDPSRETAEGRRLRQEVRELVMNKEREKEREIAKGGAGAGRWGVGGF